MILQLCKLYVLSIAFAAILNMESIATFSMFSLLLLSLLQITTCTVYTVTPDDHYYPNTTCHHCHNLQHYLLNITKYFTSNIQLLFLPGLHHLHTDLIIQNVHNISLIGSTTSDTVIMSNFSAISMINITRLTIKNIIINAYNLSEWAPLNISYCFFVSLHRLKIHIKWNLVPLIKIALVAINIMGDSYFSHVICFDEMDLFYDEGHTDIEHHSLSLNNCTTHGIKVNMLQKSYRVTLTIANMQVQHKLFDSKSFIQANELGTNELVIISCQFVSNTYTDQLFLFASTSNGSVYICNCQFIDNIFTEKDIYRVGASKKWLIKLYKSITVEFNSCNFHGKNVNILRTFGKNVNPMKVVIRNTNYTNITYDSWLVRPPVSLDLNCFMLLSHTILTLLDSVNFCNNNIVYYSIISLEGNSTVVILGTVKFSHNHVSVLISLYNNNIQYIKIKETSILNISHNKVKSLFDTNLPVTKYPIPFCFFQYYTNSTSKLRMEKRNFLIRFHNNLIKCKHVESCHNYMRNMPASNCRWLPKSLFSNIIPLEVNENYMQFINNSVTTKLSQIIEQRSLCMCANELHYDCHAYDTGYLYPGQTLTMHLYHRYAYEVTTTNAVTVKTDVNQQYVTPCIVLDINENIQFIDKNCTKLHYTIGFPTDNWCELFLKIASDSDEYLNIFYVRQMTCPTGFVKIDKRCQCDPVLVQYGITNCNINDQTISRPANNWISATTHNNSYHISLHCPFHYCLPHSSHLNFSIPNSQCQFNRSGLLCGHCQQGLSTVFSSSHCQHCCSMYLLLIIPIAIAGFVLVLVLFVLNVTVTDGTINGFILYVNIISINTPLFFAELNHFTPTYTFISLANLDLGIQTCFYNGMDDYTKMWLQLAFPFYLIFIATLIIITSRYSTTMQRLTARRGLPVLATLFLLSYTKILRIVSSVLFFYSTITHLPSKHTTLVWSVDANVTLFGVRFTILFIVCLILFLILVPFNIILLFTRTLSRFRFINKFKPLLDAYQGPYKNKFYYWTGLQLLVRAVLFGISSLDRKINITISIIIFGIMIGTHGIVRPFKIKYKNYQELVLFLNLQGLYVISLYDECATNINAVNIIIHTMITMAAVHFIFIITYHIIIYMFGGVIRNKIQLSVNTVIGWITRLRKPQPQQFQLQDNIRDNIPEVAFNYHEYREPLVGQD